jgi:2-polyprenyl-3-methyl-5-hydroxy-6-metoxy-1,4-benzoquinol methylase
VASATVEQINNLRQNTIAQHGEWTAHNIYLGNGIYTMSADLRGDEFLAKRIIQIVSDVVEKPLSEIRVLDLACLEGLYAIEFARHGARALGVEIRETNLAKARVVKDLLGIDNLDLAQDDVRNLSLEKYGSFDAVLCLGILYHLDAPDVFDFVHRMSEVTSRCLVIDTHVSTTSEASYTYRGKEYWGKYFTEHEPDTTIEEREKSLWASIDNVRSFWLTRPSLYNLLGQAGFTSVYECYYPAVRGKFDDRYTMLAIKGNQQEVLSSPTFAEAGALEWEEHAAESTDPPPRLRRLSKFVPAPVKRIIKRVL